jgi:hypothetical protein
MAAFRRFDPYAALAEDQPQTLAALAGLAATAPDTENHENAPAIPDFILGDQNQSRRDTAAKAAKPAKAEGGEPGTLAILATLAGPTPNFENPEDKRATVLSPPQWFAADSASDEPPYDEPCIARRGLVRRPEGRFEHFCAACGAWGAFGFGVTSDALGRWYCFQHRPQS